MPDKQVPDIDPEIQRIVTAARDVWVRRLIDPSRANPLLFYRDLRVGTLELSAQTEAVDLLLSGAALTIDDLASSEASDQPRNPGQNEREERDTKHSIRRSLVALQRKALSNLEEKGIQTLHLALGMATWPASDGGRPYDSPVLLLPAVIEARGRGGTELRLMVKGEPQVNPVLMYVLEDNYALRITPSSLISECCVEDDSGHWRIARDKLLARLERLATSVPAFVLRRRVILANFQFAKMAIIEDLKKNPHALASSTVVAAVAGHSTSRKTLSEAVLDIDPVQLDERPASGDFLVLDADSSQHRVLVLATKGQNGVVQGPPGTGKSQTIANLIAQSVGEGRRVLFVAEKRAALDAVIKRLSHPGVGLGHLVLDLHGASVSRKEVMARIAQTLDQVRHSAPAIGAESVHRDFEIRRRQLNEHARRINAVCAPTNLSPHLMIGRLLRLPVEARSVLRLRGDTLAALTPDVVQEIKQCLLEASSTPDLILGTSNSPWNNARIEEGHRSLEALDLATRASSELWSSFMSSLQQAVSQTGVRMPETMLEVSSLLHVLSELTQIGKQYDMRVFTSLPGDLARALTPATRGAVSRCWAFLTNTNYRAARSLLLGLRLEPASVNSLHQDVLHIADVLQGWQGLQAASSTPVLCESLKELSRAFVELRHAAKALEGVADLGRFTDGPLTDLYSHLRSLAADRRTPHLLPRVHAIRSRLEAAGLTQILADLRDNAVAPEHWAARFEYVWLYSALEQALASDPALASFNGRTHEQLVAEFVRYDRERVRLASDRVRRLHAERAVQVMNQNFEQANLVRTESAKRSRHIPLRELLARAPDVLTRIAPCWVASPLSVSQLLDGNRHFDLVIFDEASQILQEEAIPALYRAQQVVVAGDRHQLPPTTFFATSIEDEDDVSPEEATVAPIPGTSIGGFESLLGTLEAFLPNWLLDWHYRSEDERLITFSNAHIYSGRLVTFPSARNHQAIAHVLVSHDSALGAQEESSSQEVSEVVRQVLSHAETRPNESLGVITMGIKHANRILAALDRALDLRPDLGEFFSLGREERFFVKNLETVQGDERDAIILSIGYGKSANGDLPHRFGPLTQDVGYRRLNVAVTRARLRMSVVSSFAHDEINLNRSGSRGVQLLKAYLEYAASGGGRLPEAEVAGYTELNPFEADVRDALETNGVTTRSQFGASRYRIDLVAMHPSLRGRPVMAIECDGASYHSGATARDRDRLRQEHLMRLGWRFHRIWSTDWFFDREQEIARMLSAFQEAVRRSDASESSDGPPGTVSHSVVTPSESRQTSLSQRGPRPLVQVKEAIDQYSNHELTTIADWIVSDGLLRTDEELIKEIFHALPFQRLGPRIRQRLESIARTLRLQQRPESS